MSDPIQELVERYRKLKAEKDQIESSMDEIKSELQPYVEASGGKWQDERGYARMVSTSPSVGYDTKAIEALVVSMPEIKAALWPHRTEKPGKSYLQIK